MSEFTTTTLERMTFGAQQAFSQELAGDVAMPGKLSIAEHMGLNLALSVRQEIYAQHLEKAIVRYPETWKDAVLNRFYGWLRSGHWPWGADLMEARWPAQWHEVSIDVKALYPKIGLPHERSVVRVERAEGVASPTLRLWFDATGRDISDVIYELYYKGRSGQTWMVGRQAYRALRQAKDKYTLEYLFMTPWKTTEQLFDMSIVIDRTVPEDTIELRDTQDKLVGKIYNIG